MPTSLQLAVARLTAAAHDPRTDARLVADFLRTADQHAFAELVRRHGPAVLGVCTRVLGHTPDAEDAFQATFLVLVRRARATDWRESLGPWLYGVALKVARKARAVRAKRLVLEAQVPAMTSAPTPPAEPDDTAAVVDEELAALPARLRQPLVLCEIQGHTRRDAARELGLPEGTLSSRLARGRTLLRARLARRGLAPGALGAAVAVPAPLATATVQNATHLLKHAAGAVPAGVLALTEGVMKTMIAKWKLVAVTIATCVGLTSAGAWRESPAQDVPVPGQPARAVPVAKAPPGKPVPEKAPDAPKPPEPVATIFGDVPVSREAFTDHLIRRYGKKELEQFVNKQIIAHAFAQKGWVLKPDDVQAELDNDCKALGVTRERFVKDVLPKYRKTLEEWVEDEIAMRLMLGQLCKTKLPAVTEADLRQAFDAKYGEKLECRVITWTKDEGDAARKAYEKVRDSEAEFASHARQNSNASLAASGGRIAPISRTPPPDGGDVQRAVRDLKAGEVSPLIATADGFMVVKCDRVIPADKTKSFDAEKPMLLAKVLETRLNNEIPKLFKDLKQQANPTYHLTFPDPVTAPNPAPAKKPSRTR
ncbi:sigma-70 family RNA polymerase sigma factor [Frigoriglobus tundricola]|uniref:PpiC domain-containing protein n=1 Tax=Frigoriglobus tundricola TaxID=2774151 RepID=A0A6M5Z055_9BACT|nr:sigma-70 family RNA polymerase sigma factor [Frigoriglobus tundricola]QJW98821.1 hypothetical protein FTUN_6416 [Frigoriglobus tundricola]